MEYLWFEMFVIFLGIFVSKFLADKTNSVDVLWYIVIGAILGNIGLLHEEHQIEFLADIGIILVMFALGFEENLANFLKGVKRAWGIAVIGAIFPFLAGYISAKMFGFSTTSALIWGLTMTATAVSITMMSLKSLRLEKTPAATGIMTSAVVDDVLSLIGVAILLPIILGSKEEFVFDLNSLFKTILDVIEFFAIIYVISRFIVPHHKGIRYLFKVKDGNYAVIGVFILVFMFGSLAHMFGFHPAIGAYFAGLILKAEYFETKTQNRVKEIEHITNNLAFKIFGPIFFIFLGSKIIVEFSVLKDIIIPVLVLFILVLVFQILSAAGAAKFTGGYSNRDSLLIGIGMLGRAELAFIVMNIAYVQNSLISKNEFFILIFTTFLLNISVPLLLKLYKPIYTRS